MMRSLYTGVSGLTNHQVRMDVLSNNIANVNTIGYKANRTVFADTLSQSMAGAAPPTGNRGGVNPMQIGLGVQTAAIDVLFTQGSHQTTNKYTDVAINGNGFFVVSDGLQQYYTRAGNFGFDLDGNLTMNGSTLKVQGWMADANFNINSAAPVSDIVIPSTMSVASVISTTADYFGNLKANDEISKRYSSSVNLVDSLGVEHDGRTTYTKIDDLTWIAHTTVAGATGAVTDDLRLITFDSNGNFQSSQSITGETVRAPGGAFTAAELNLDLDFTAPTIGTKLEQGVVFRESAGGEVHVLGVRSTCTNNAPPTWQVEILENGNVLTTQSYTAPGNLPTVTLSNGSTYNFAAGSITAGGTNTVTTTMDQAGLTLGSSNTISFNPGGGATNPQTVTLDFSKLTQYGTAGDLKATTDGYRAGTMKSQSIDQAGVIVGHFDNGKNFNLGQIAMASFQNQEGLEKVGGTLFRETNNSGTPNIGEAGTSNRGSLSPGKLEMANVDLSEEFTNMIVTQRGFQSNSRVITTSDEMLQELIGLKR